jgi:putative Ca2+/H+ antiporter (TMEM165/GDT1 family)
VFLAGGVLLLRAGDGEQDVHADPVHSVWGVVGRSALIIGIAEFGDFTQLATVGIVADRGYPVVVAAGSVAAHIVVAAIAVLAGRWLQRKMPVHLVRRTAGLLFVVFGAVTAVSAVRG